jgi:glycerol-3-phosphate acyltransferase PlsX
MKKKQIHIAIDAMGGDIGPAVTIPGAAKLAMALNNGLSVNFTFFGDETAIRQQIKQYPMLSDIHRVVHTDEQVTGDDKPTKILRHGRQTSMGLAIESVAEGDSDAIVSCGNTGALMVLSRQILGMLDGVDRPAIGTYFPSTGGNGKCLMLDLGANAECNADHLFQFATLGTVYARAVGGIEDPRLGIINIGEEGHKGNKVVQQAMEKLSDVPLPADFVGFIEGDDVPNGDIDVAVTDGFTGNIGLKMAEGTAQLASHYFKQTFANSWRGKLAYLIARPVFKRLRQLTDPRQYNGALLLGLKGISIKSHGGTDALGFGNALELAVNTAKGNYIERVGDEFDRLTAKMARDEESAVSNAMDFPS